MPSENNFQNEYQATFTSPNISGVWDSTTVREILARRDELINRVEVPLPDQNEPVPSVPISVNYNNWINSPSYNYTRYATDGESAVPTPSRSLSDRDVARQIVMLSNGGYRVDRLRTTLRECGVTIPESVDRLNGGSYVNTHLNVLVEAFPTLSVHLHECTFCSNPSFDAMLVEDARVCRRCQIDNVYTWASGERRLTPEPIRNIGSYHGYNRNIIMKGVNWKDSSLLGIEIEAHIPHLEPAKTRIVLESIKDKPILPETDSSLDRNFGVEFVFAPTPFDKIVDGCFIHEWAKILQSHGCKGWHAGDNYGMHVSINAAAMTQLHIGKFCHFINTNRVLGEKIAGRNANRFANYLSNGLTGFRDETSKYMAASRRSRSRIEVRIFKSSLNWHTIQRNCQFVHSVMQFSKSASMSRLNAVQYLIFLDKEDNKKQYGVLREFLGIAKPNKNVKLIKDEELVYA